MFKPTNYFRRPGRCLSHYGVHITTFSILRPSGIHALEIINFCQRRETFMSNIKSTACYVIIVGASPNSFSLAGVSTGFPLLMCANQTYGFSKAVISLYTSEQVSTSIPMCLFLWQQILNLRDKKLFSNNHS